MRTMGWCVLWLLGVSAFGQKVVNNGEKDAGYSLTLTEELRFGGDGEEDVLLWTDLNTRLFPGPDGGMFIFDFAERRVLSFDKNGGFLKQVVGSGNGPGELQRLLSVSQTADGSFVVMDSPPRGLPTLKFYGPDMTFKEQLSTHGLGFMPSKVGVSPDGNYLAGLFMRPNPKERTVSYQTGLYSLKDKALVRTFYEHKGLMPDRARMQEPAMWEDLMSRELIAFYRFGIVRFGANGTCYWAVSDKYKIHGQQPEAEGPELVFGRTFNPYPFDDEAQAATIDHFWENLTPGTQKIISKSLMERAFKKADLPPVKAPLVDLIPIEDKALLAIHHVDSKTRVNRGDVFSLDGRFLCSIDVADYGLFVFTTSNPVPRMVFRDGFAYTLHTDEDGTNRAVRYRYQLGEK